MGTRILLLISLVVFLGRSAHAELVSTAVGLIGKRAVTSREVRAQHLIDVALTEPLDREALKIHDLDSRAFARDTQDVLQAAVVAMEAQSFNLMQITPDELARAKRQAAQVLGARREWTGLRVDPREFEESVRRILQSRRFVKFRAESSALPVTDVDIQRSFDENHAVHGNLPFEKVREAIKSSLAKAQTEKRLKDWFDGLSNKYQVKNLIAEM